MSEKDYENALGQFHKLPKWAREAIKNQLSALNLKIIAPGFSGNLLFDN